LINKIQGEELTYNFKSFLFSSQAPFFDSGTTFVYFTSDLFANFVSYFHSACSKNSANCGGTGAHHECYHFDAKKYESFESFAKTFPEISFQFNENERVKWLPRDYLAVSLESKEHFCIGVKSLKTPILGALFMKNYDVYFDRINKKIEMTRSNCGSSDDFINPTDDQFQSTFQSFDINHSGENLPVSEEIVENTVNLTNRKHSKGKKDNYLANKNKSDSGLKSYRLVGIVLMIVFIQALVVFVLKYFW